MATGIEYALLQLLVEFDDFANRNGLRYVLANHTAWDAQKTGRYHEGLYETAILMPEADFIRLATMELPKGRAIIEQNRRGYSAKYADMTSSFVDCANDPDWDNPVPGIDISVAREASASMSHINAPRGKEFELPSSMFDFRRRAALEGHLFYTFADTNTYFEQLAGEDWRIENWPLGCPRTSENLVYRENIAPAEFLELESTRKLRSHARSMKVRKRLSGIKKTLIG